MCGSDFSRTLVRLKLLRRDARMARAQDALERPDPQQEVGLKPDLRELQQATLTAIVKL